MEEERKKHLRDGILVDCVEFRIGRSATGILCTIIHLHKDVSCSHRSGSGGLVLLLITRFALAPM